MDFIRINNRKNFLISEVPKLHPKSSAYIKYWKLHKKRCIEGFWSKDDNTIQINCDEEIPNEILQTTGNWRYAPPNLYFYVNFGIILHKPDDAPKSAPKKLIRPLLRDIEWELYYNWLEARGFSGFSDDEEFSCNTELVEYAEKVNFKYSKSCYNSKGVLKKYTPVRDYLRKLHDIPLGKPLYDNMARDLFWLSARGIGKSFSVAVGIILHELLFDGAKDYTEDSIKNPYKVEIFVGAALSSKSSDLLKKVSEAMNNLPGAWAQNTNDYEPSPLYKKMEGTLSPNNQKNPWRHEYQKKVGGSWTVFGSGSNIKHGTYTIENPEAAAGGRYSVMVKEEVGLMPNAKQVHGSDTATMQDPPWKFGSSIWIGTGGNVDKIQEFETMFRDPVGFEALSFDDVWEGTGKIGWFVPCFYGMNDYKDENGNTLIEEAIAHKEKDRVLKRKSRDSSTLANEMMNFPFVPSEMFLNATGSMFPQVELKAHLGDLKSNPHKYENSHWFVDLVWDSKGDLIIENLDAQGLVNEFPIKDNKNKPGVIEIFQMPKYNGKNEIPIDRYIQGTDTYDDDESSTNSLGSTFVFDLYTSKIVAEYTGRRGSKEFYEITRKLNIFYRATHNYEKNKKGLYVYYDNKNSTHLLCDTPESLKDVADVTISKVGNQAKGTHTSTPVTAYGLRLILDWLLEPAYGEEETSEVLNLHKIESIGLIQELMNYNPNGNFDRVSALIMVMILREDKIKFISKRQEQKVKDLADDDFFTSNYFPEASKNMYNGF
jgi:hypothetical protein